MRSKNCSLPGDSSPVDQSLRVTRSGECITRFRFSRSSLFPITSANDSCCAIIRGDYLYQLKDHIAYRYELMEPLGRGSFGQVVKVLDHKRKEYAALKIIRNKKKFYNQAIIELKILKYIRDNDPHNQTNIVKIKDFVIFRNHVVTK